MTNIQDLMLNGASPMKRTANYTWIKKGTIVPYHGIHVPTLNESVPLQVPIPTVFLAQLWKNTLQQRIRNSMDLNQKQIMTVNTTENKTYIYPIIPGNKISSCPPPITVRDLFSSQYHTMTTYRVPSQGSRTWLASLQRLLHYLHQW